MVKPAWHLKPYQEWDYWDKFYDFLMQVSMYHFFVNCQRLP